MESFDWIRCHSSNCLVFIRLKMKDSTSFEKLHMKNVRYRDYPWWLIVKFYWFRLTIVSMIWFIYNFSVYSFGTFNAIILGQIILMLHYGNNGDGLLCSTCSIFQVLSLVPFLLITSVQD